MDIHGNPTRPEVDKYIADINQKFTGQTWFDCAEMGYDDGGMYILIRVTCRKDATDAGFRESDYPRVKFCFYSLVP